MACGCRTSGECWHFTKLQWEAMRVSARRMARARLLALNELYYCIESSVRAGLHLPEGVVEAVHKVEAAERGQEP